MSTITLGAPLTVEQSSVVKRAESLRQRAESVKTSLESAPSESVSIDQHDSNERLGLYYYKGKIGRDEYSNANATLKEGRVDAFAAHDPQGVKGETLKFHTVRSKATGLRAAAAAAFGGIAGGLGNAAAWFLAKAWTSENRLGANALAVLSKPLSFASDLMRVAESKIDDPGTRDQVFAQSNPDGTYEQYVFTAGGELQAETFRLQN